MKPMNQLLSEIVVKSGGTVTQYTRNGLLRDWLDALTVVQRTFIDCDPLLQTHYVLENPVTLSGDFRLEVDIALPLGAIGSLALFSDNLGADLDWFRIDASNSGLDAKFDGAFYSDDGGLALNQNLNNVSFERIGSTLTKRFGGEVAGVKVGVSTATVIVGAIGARGGAIKNYFNGVLANPSITDLSNPSNTESWKLDQPYPTNTEQSSSGSNTLTYVNAAESTRDNYTLSNDGTQWNGDKGGVIVIA